MKRLFRYFIFFWFVSVSVMFLCGCDEKSGPDGPGKSTGQLSVPHVQDSAISQLQPTLEKAIRTFFYFLEKADTNSLLASVFQDSEYVMALKHYPTLKPPENIPATAKSLARSNHQNLLSWMAHFHKNGFQYLNYKVIQKPIKESQFTLIQGIDIWVTNPDGEPVRFPVFKTVVRLNGGYKIWSILKGPK